MYRELQVHDGKSRNAMRTVKVDMVRGTLVTIDADNKLVKGAGVAGLRIVNRGLNKDYRKSLDGFVSDYDVVEDTCKAGEFVAEVAMEAGERYGFQVADADAITIGAFLEATAGVFTVKATGTSQFRAAGVYNDNGKKLLIVDVL